MFIKKILNGREKGQVLILALALLGLGGVLIAPMMSYVGTGLIAGAEAEDKIEELYAADAGVQDAIWKINNSELVPGFPNCWDCPQNPPTQIKYMEYDIGLAEGTNDLPTHVYLEYINGDNLGTYLVRSDAGDTRIISIITSIWLDYSGITNNVITTPNEYTTQGPTILEPGEGEEHGPVENYGGPWPGAEDLIGFYLQPKYVDINNPYSDDELLLTGADTNFGPEYIDSDFYIHSNANQNETLILDGNLYITGQATLGGPKDFTLDLNGNTIFVESNVTGGGASGTALWIAGNVSLTGSGCIIAIGDINFEPQMVSAPDDYILILSVDGQTWMHPNGDFYGTLAGNSEVFIQNGTAYWVDPETIEGDLIFPIGSGEEIWGVHSWYITEP
ncbi:MAG: hypothetical protein JSV32_03385 [Dehalococcoidia bacterium]|nr:MAG: hypothetical protein JSV32_03385 [Dehalococcoidia bacterium]